MWTPCAEASWPRRRAPWSTSSARPSTQAADEPAVDTGADVLTYEEFAEAAEEVAEELNALGVGTGDKVGVRIAVGHDRPLHRDHRRPAGRRGVRPGGRRRPRRAGPAGVRRGRRRGHRRQRPDGGASVARDHRGSRSSRTADDDAWVIFTSGSTGTPKGVAVTHRNAAAFVDAESRMFLQAEPLGVGDRVMAGLSVAFDASCEEMWLAWRYGACLVPAPRALVKSGIDVGPWLVANDITVVSTVPTLVALWPTESLDRRPPADHGRRGVPPELAARLVRAGPRGVEHLRPDRGDGRRLRRRADRRRAGPDRAAARRLGPRGRRRRRAGRCPRAPPAS